jgi:hypothetical protein
MGQTFRKIIFILLIIKLMSALIASFGYFSHPHIIRQVDTMSVGLNYWLRWTEGNPATWFLPGSLGAGDSAGISPMEFPLMNILIAPFFYFGHNDGYTLSLIFIIILSFGLFYLHFKEWNKVSEHMGDSSLLMGIFGISSIYIVRIMPLPINGFSQSCVRPKLSKEKTVTLIFITFHRRFNKTNFGHCLSGNSFTTY